MLFFRRTVLVAAMLATKAALAVDPTPMPSATAMPECPANNTLIKAASVFCPFDAAVTEAKAEVEENCNDIENANVSCKITCKSVTAQLKLGDPDHPPYCTANGQTYLAGCQESPNPETTSTTGQIGYKKFKRGEEACYDYAESIDCSPAVAAEECGKGIENDVKMIEQHGSGLCCNPNGGGGPAPTPGGTPPTPPTTPIPTFTATVPPEWSQTEVAPEPQPSWVPSPSPSATPQTLQQWFKRWF